MKVTYPLAAGVALALGLTACGEKEAATTPPPAPTATITVASPANGDPITVDSVVDGEFGTEKAVYTDTAVPDGLTIWGSWRGGDDRTGSVTWELPALEAGEVLHVAYMTGPHAAGQSITLTDAEGVELVSYSSLHGEWVTLELSYKGTVTLKASDASSEFGEWSAISEPQKVAK